MSLEEIEDIEEIINNQEKYPRYTNREELKKSLLESN